MPNIEEKKPNKIFDANCLEKEQICEFWRQKRQSGNPGYRACERTVRSLAFIA